MDKGKEPHSGEPVSGNLAVCAFISRSHLFKKIADEDLASLYDACRLRRYKKGEAILNEGDEGTELFLLMSGNVRVVTGGQSGLVELAQLARGAFFGEVSLLTGRPRTATIVAMDDVEVVAISNKGLEGILKRYPRVRKLMQTVVEGRVRTAIEKTQQ